METNKTFVRNVSNNLTLSGLIDSKPLFGEIKRDNGQISKWCVFSLVQNIVGFKQKIYTKKFYCRTRSPEIIEELKKYDHQIYVTCLGKLDYMFIENESKPIYYPLIEEMHVEIICPERLLEKEKNND